MAVQLAFKRRVHLRDGAPAAVRAPRVSRLALPIAAYWLLCAALTYGAVCGVVPLRKWLDDDVAESASTRRAVSTPRRRAVPVAPAATAPNRVPADLQFTSDTTPFVAEPVPRAVVATLQSEPKREEQPIDSSRTVTSRRVADDAEPAAPPNPLPTFTHEPPPSEPSPALQAHRVDDAPSAPSSLTSCEAALAAYNESLDLSGRNVPDLPRAAYAAVLENGGYLLRCGVPSKMSIDICAAIQEGRAVGVTIVTNPPSARVRACVAAAVRSLRFPVHPRLDVTRTRFDEQP